LAASAAAGATRKHGISSEARVAFDAVALCRRPGAPQAQTTHQMNTRASDRLQDIFRAVFGLPQNADVVNLDQTNSPRWDSLDHVSLVAAIESEFGVSLDAADQFQMSSYSAIARLVEEKSA
jgi:acyl carrier protein